MCFKNIEKLFDIMEGCQGIEQVAKYHPEGDVFTHLLQVLHCAMLETDNLDLIFAAMLHDVGKQIESNGHANHAITMLDGLISEKTAWLIKNHMRFWDLIEGEMRKQSKVKELFGHPWFVDLCMLVRWDKMGRNPHLHLNYDKSRIIDKILSKSEVEI